MRSDHRAALERPYDQSPESSDEPFARTINAFAPSVRDLAEAVLEDLDNIGTAYGVHWWETEDDGTHRAVVGDYLFSVIDSVSVNLVEARLHQWELVEVCDAEEERLARSTHIGVDGEPVMVPPPRTCGLDDHPRLLRELHLAGVLRAVGSTLDCLAGALVGVLALPMNVQRVSLHTVQEHLDAAATRDHPMADLWTPAAALLKTSTQSPVDGWLSWATAYRNTLVHRARPAMVSISVPRPTLHRADGGPPHILTTVTALAPSNPQYSDIEMYALADGPVLTEDVRVTAEGLVDATLSVAEQLAEFLLSVWRSRASNPNLHAQPVMKQWPRIPSNEPSGFQGFRPGSVPFDSESLTIHPRLGRRLDASGVLDDDDLWDI